MLQALGACNLRGTRSSLPAAPPPAAPESIGLTKWRSRRRFSMRLFIAAIVLLSWGDGQRGNAQTDKTDNELEALLDRGRG